MGTFSSFIAFAFPSYLWGCWWQDIAEISFFSTSIYYISCWLKKDTQKPLLLYFYSYCLLLLSAHYGQLATISSLLFFATPIIALLFIIFHQDCLQRQMIALKKHMPAQKATQEDWLEKLLRSCLIALDKKNRPIQCIIERTDSLHQFLNTSLVLQIPLQENLLDVLFASSAYDPSQLVWLSWPAHLCGINARWKTLMNQEVLSAEIVTLPLYLQHALFFTTKTDAAFFTLSPDTRTMDVVIDGKIYEKISTQHALIILKKYFRSSQKTRIKGAYTHETLSHETTPRQPSS